MQFYPTLGHLLQDPQIGGWAGLVIYAALGIGLGVVIGRYSFGKKKGATEATIRNGSAIGGMLGLLAGMAMNEVKPLDEAILEYGGIFLMLLSVVGGILLYKVFSDLLGEENKTWSLLISIFVAFFTYYNLSGDEAPAALQMVSTLGLGGILFVLVAMSMLSSLSHFGLGDPSGNKFQKGIDFYDRWRKKDRGDTVPDVGTPSTPVTPDGGTPAAPSTPTPSTPATESPPGTVPKSTPGTEAMDEALSVLEGI